MTVPQKQYVVRDNQALDKDLSTVFSYISRADVADVSPNGNQQGRIGDFVLYNNGGSFELWVNTSGDTTWQRVNFASTGMVSYIGQFTRDMTIASGTQVISSVGFKPTVVIFLAFREGAINWSLGFDTQTTHSVGATRAGDLIYAGGNSIQFNDVGGNYYGVIQTMDTDGFTIAWTKDTLPTGTLTVNFMAMK